MTCSFARIVVSPCLMSVDYLAQNAGTFPRQQCYTGNGSMIGLQSQAREKCYFWAAGATEDQEDPHHAAAVQPGRQLTDDSSARRAKKNGRARNDLVAAGIDKPRPAAAFVSQTRPGC